MKKAEKQEGMKRCTKCGKIKDKSEFHKHAGLKDGLSYTCKECNRRYAHMQYRKKCKSVKQYLRYEERHRVVRGVRQKQCCNCRKWKVESDFYKRQRSKDGLEERCKECSYKAVRKSRKRRLTGKNKIFLAFAHLPRGRGKGVANR